MSGLGNNEFSRKFNPEFVELAKAFTYEKMYDDDKINMPYRFFRPHLEDEKEYPLVIYIHGVGERGDDNEVSLVGHIGGTIFATTKHQKKNPCFILVPQIPTITGIQMLIKYMECLRNQVVKTINDYPIDRKRIYITGISMGAIATYYLISHYPNLFAAAMPICGAAPLEGLRAIQNVPIWAFHAADDMQIPVENAGIKEGYDMYGTRAIISFLKENGHKNLHYTEYPEGYIQEKYGFSHSHPSWEEAYRNEEAIDWLFKQVK